MEYILDYNFFEPLKKRKRKTNTFQLLIVSVMIIAVVGAAGYMAVNYIEYLSLETQINTLENQLNDPVFLQQQQELAEQKARLSNFLVQQAYLESVSDFVNQADTGTWMVINEISNQIPMNLNLTDISVNGQSITIAGVATDTLSIAQFQTYLRECEVFDDIWTQWVKADTEKITYTNGTTGDADVYVFEITMVYVPPVNTEQDALPTQGQEPPTGETVSDKEGAAQ